LLEELLQRDGQAVGHEGEEDVCVDARFVLMVGGADGQVAIQSLDR
jgi:hypothetical protein